MNEKIGFFGVPVTAWSSPPCGPPLRPLVYCLKRVEAWVGLSIGFNDLLKTRLPHGISKQPSPSA